jgi:adenosylhomocysteine nucleosidase
MLKMKDKIIGIMGAMPEEVDGIVNLLTEKEEHRLGMRTYFVGRINGIKTIVVFSRWGKVAAATTASTLILKFNVSEIIFTGVAGAISPNLNIGDIVIGKRLIQHDLSGQPLMEAFEIPLLKIKYIEIQSHILKTAKNAVNNLLKNTLTEIINPVDLKQFNITKPKLLIGDIASGDRFFASTKDKNNLLEKLPATLCVEMEGAAVAQACYEYEIPFTVLRTISDTADENSHIDFADFIAKIANKYSVAIIKHIFNQF